jgi:calcineurin-like phosphoesterase family protein
MHEVITTKWNHAVNNNDHVFVVGDIAWKVSGKNFNYYKKLINGLNGNIHLILGNHDKSNQSFNRLFEEVVDYKELADTVNGEKKRVILSHYYIPFYNHHYRGAIMLHGHSHNSAESDMERRLTAMLNRQGFPCQIYNVGCMYPYIDYAPRTLQYIVDHYDNSADYSRNAREDDDFEDVIQALLDYHKSHPDKGFIQTLNGLLVDGISSMTDKTAVQKICSHIGNHSEVRKRA